MNGLITICARGGSKGIPGKNIQIVNGIPLIAYSINTALEFSHQNVGFDISLSTDSFQIKNVALEYGLHSDYLRPEYLAGDTIGKVDVIRDLLKHCELKENKRYDLIIDLDVTSPLRSISDLNKGLEILTQNESALTLFSVNKSNRNPYFNMVELKSNGYYNVVKRSKRIYLSRQIAPLVFDLNASFYIYRRSFFSKNYKSVITNNSLVYQMPHLCFDVDHEIDLEFLRFLLESNKVDLIE